MNKSYYIIRNFSSCKNFPGQSYIEKKIDLYVSVYVWKLIHFVTLISICNWEYFFIGQSNSMKMFEWRITTKSQIRKLIEYLALKSLTQFLVCDPLNYFKRPWPVQWDISIHLSIDLKWENNVWKRILECLRLF